MYFSSMLKYGLKSKHYLHVVRGNMLTHMSNNSIMCVLIECVYYFSDLRTMHHSHIEVWFSNLIYVSKAILCSTFHSFDINLKQTDPHLWLSLFGPEKFGRALGKFGTHFCDWQYHSSLIATQILRFVESKKLICYR